MQKRILIIEDEISIQNIIKAFLEDAGYQADTASNGLEGINAFRTQPYDAILLDLMLPKIDGYTLCEMIRQESDVPIIMLTAMDEEDNQIKGFDLQADDYITKPFSMKLVIKRIEAVLRRREQTRTTINTNILRHKALTMNTESCEVFVSGRPVLLTTKEFSLLRLFLEQKDRVFTRENLLNAIWGYNYVGDEKIINTHIKNIRKKLGVDYIETVRGMGYKIAKEN